MMIAIKKVLFPTPDPTRQYHNMTTRPMMMIRILLLVKYTVVHNSQAVRYSAQLTALITPA
eukprot:scaffold4211_cov180-Chaetoceros_neogracile.AAC.2